MKRILKCFGVKLLQVLKKLMSVTPYYYHTKERSQKQYEIGSGEGSHPEEVEDYYRCIYFEALDLTISGIQN